MSQEKLGESIGLTFQQVQKYERGSNRISAGTLYRLGQVLDVPISFFFDSYDDPHSASHQARNEDSDTTAESIISRREARLLRLWRAAPAHVADELLSLLGSLSPDLREAQDGVQDAPQGTIGDDAHTPPTATNDAPAGRSAASRESSSRSKSKSANKTRRRHGAVWDPADIYRAAKAPPPTR
ncbi:transcriptional regulator with XRE-family HTH domain [Azospirillum soli]|nr:transcriptional regulator with XRE-family HTH domain [Azospirillum soli]